ncbi:MAG: DUF4158 domain-containing protein [Hydrococcus sp. SU_1_0]|nr:DUF4158 domain-containing protein [Hydrococcus sp. SU_1_0]NJO97601.1 DUF4158 domain-containing protein [Pleurocapsa sp. CRU_1_2]
MSRHKEPVKKSVSEAYIYQYFQADVARFNMYLGATPTKAETAYPRLKNYVTSRELTEIYTPTQQELALANQHTKKGVTKLGFLVLLKTFQRLGYFVDSDGISSAIVSHIIKCAQLSVLPSCLTSYEQSKTKKRHIALIREFLSIKSYGVEARKIVVRSMGQAARTKNDLADIINVAIEELVHHRHELPVFNTLVRAAKRVRGTIVAYSTEKDDQIVKLLNLEWIPQKWWQLITNQKTKKSYPDTINRRYFEMCVFSQVMWELKSGDLYVEDSDAFADYRICEAVSFRTQQISWAEYEANIDEFGKLYHFSKIVR